MAFRYLIPALAFDFDVLAYRASVQGYGGTVSDARMAILNTFVGAEKAAGLWGLTDDYLGPWAENAIQALTSLKQRRLATVTAAPTFTTDRGYAFNGTTQYIDTGFVPSTHAVAMTTSSVHVEVYERTSTNATGADTLGVQDSAARAINIRSRVSGTLEAAANSTGGSYTLASATSLGLSQVGRNGSLTSDHYGAKNGVDLVTATSPTAVGASLPTLSLFIGGTNAGFLARPRACSVGYAAWGAALTSAQRLARYNNVQAWATAVGANV